MSRKKISFGFVLGSLNLFIDGLVGLATLPILLRYLDKEKAGLWILITSFGALISLSQAGLGPVVVRMAAELRAAEDCTRSKHFFNLVRTSYLFVMLIVLGVSAGIYFLYLNNILSAKGHAFEGLLVWTMYSLGYAIKMFATKNLHIVNGYGELGWDKLLYICSTLFLFVGYYCVLWSHFDLIGLGFVSLCVSILFWVGSFLLVKRFVQSDVELDFSCINKVELIDMFKQSSKMLILNLSGFFVMNLDIFIIERMIGLKVLPLYSALVKIVTIIISISLLIQQMTYPYVALSWSKQQYDECKKLYRSGIIYSLGVGFLMSCIFFFAAPYFVPLWLGKGLYLGGGIFGLQLLFALIYIHHCAHANPVLATGGRTFISTAIINAILAVPLSITGGYFFGIKGILIGNIIATIVPSSYVVLWSYRFFKNLPASQGV